MKTSGFGREAEPDRARAWSVEVEGPGWRNVIRLFFGSLHGLFELLFEESVPVFHGGHLLSEDLLGLVLVSIEVFEEGLEVLAPGQRLLDGAVGENLTGCGIDNQMRLAFWTAKGERPCLCHGACLF